MDEVKAMAAAGEQVGRAVGTGVRAVRHAATRAGMAGATASRQAAARAQQELAGRDITAGELREAITEQAARRSHRARRRMARKAYTAREELAARIDSGTRRRYPRWPWILLVLAALGLAAAVVLSRRREEPPATQAEAEPDRPPEQDAKRPWNSNQGEQRP